MNKKVKVGQLADTISKELQEYAAQAADSAKEAVKKAGKTVKKEIESTAPVATGKYAKSWTVKKQKETDYSIDVVVHSKTSYRLAHLLEFGHAKRGGGRVAARPHLAAAEEIGIDQLQKEIERALEGGLN